MAKEFVTAEAVKLPRASKGKRPHFFDDPAIDQIMTFVLELMTEVAVLRERSDTVERLFEAKKLVSRDEVENYTADAAVEAERIAWREAFVQRALRMHQPD